MPRSHSIKQDDTLHPDLKEAVTGIRGGIVEQAETVSLPDRFSVTPSPDAPSMIITDQVTGRTTVVGLYAYREVRNALHALFSPSMHS